MVERRKPAPPKRSVSKKAKGKTAANVHAQDVTYPYCYKSQEKRLQALQMQAQDFVKLDPFMQHLLTNAETLFEPKMIHRKIDWLVKHREVGQDIAKYCGGSPNITWYNPTRQNIIYLFSLDQKIPQELVSSFMAYVAAFFHGVPCKKANPGTKLKAKGKNAAVEAVLPEDLVAQHEIPTRTYKGDQQVNAALMLEELRQYKVNDTFAIVALLDELDLYLCDDEEILKKQPYVYGLANPAALTSVVSFKRHKEDAENRRDTNEQTWFKQTCHTIVHEIGHLFGLAHCIYYECIMNAAGNPVEKIRRENRTLCPVCLCKLTLNIKFDTRERFEHLIRVCNELGFISEAQTYQQMLLAVP